MGMEIYNQYVGQITCAYPEDIYIDSQGRSGVKAARTKEREKYLFRGFGNSQKEPILIDCPPNVLAIEFEGTRPINLEIINEVEKKARKLQLDYCIVDHGGTSPYFYAWNLMGLPEGYEKEAKKIIADMLVPKKYADLLDKTNLGKTLIPIIGKPHWKAKYKGAMHKIIRGKAPEAHYNKIEELIIKFQKPSPKKTIESDDECEAIKRSLSLRDVLSHYGMNLSHNPTQCLWHSSKGGKCFSFDTSKDIFYCFHCEKTGNIFHFVMEEENCEFIKAKQICADMCGYRLKESKKKQELIIDSPIKINDCIENVETFYGKQPFFYDKTGAFWFWQEEDCRWANVDEIDLMNSLDENLNMGGQTVNIRVKNDYLEAFKRVGRKKIPKEPPKSWVQFKDKIIDIKTGERHEASPNYFITNPIPWEIGEKEDTPTMDRLFGQWVGKEYVPTLYEILAYSCLPEYPIHIIVCLFGCGRNGKGRFQALISKFLGESNICASELDQLVKDRFEAHKLYKKLVCQVGETNFGLLKNTSTLKKISGQDKLGFQKKYGQLFDDYNYAKIIMNSNSLPTTDDTTDGFWSRWLIIDFPNQFKGGKDVLETIPDYEYNNLARKVLNILKNLLDKGEFTNQGTIADRRKRYMMVSNPIEYFIEECCDTNDPNGYVNSTDLWKAYRNYLQNRKLRPVKRSEFNFAINECGYFQTRTTKKVVKSGNFGEEKYESGFFFEGIKLNS